MGEWKVLPKGPTAESPKKLPTVTVRRMAIAYNKFLRDAAKLDDFQRVTIHVDDIDCRIGLMFHNDLGNENAYAVHFDGGTGSRQEGASRTKRTFATQCQFLMSAHPWVRKIAQLEDVAYRRFVARFDARDNLWIIQMRPSFELAVSSHLDIPSAAKGIYRYIHKEEVVYIGQGAIRSRAQESHRDQWDFDGIEYSIIEDKDARERYETEWIALHEARHGKRPRYNRNSGRKFTE